MLSLLTVKRDPREEQFVSGNFCNKTRLYFDGQLRNMKDKEKVLKKRENI